MFTDKGIWYQTWEKLLFTDRSPTFSCRNNRLGIRVQNLYSAEDSIQELNLAGGQEQLEYQYRPMAPAEEEISRIYEDGIYHPPDMIERPGRSCTFQTDPQQSVKEAFYDPTNLC